jgi:hypothetical protein
VSTENEALEWRELLTKFLRMKVDTDLVFECKKNEGEAIIARMRVKLSKLRGKAIAQGRTVKAFKMYQVGIEDLGNGKEKVTLRKTASSASFLLDKLEEIPDGVTY